MTLSPTNSVPGIVRPNTIDLGIRLSQPLNSSGQAEQTCVGVVLGGGSGKNVLNAMLEQCDGRLPEKMFVAAIDSDPDPCGLPTELFIPLTVPQADLLVQRRQHWPSIDLSVPDSYKPGDITRGSKQKRMVTAGVVLPFYRELLRNQLTARFVRPMLAIGGVGDNCLRGGRCRVVIHLVGSLGGGFGSAIKDEIPALLRDLFRQRHEGVIVHIVWHVFTSNVHRDVLPMTWQKCRADANAFSSLLEFEAGYLDPSSLPWKSLGMAPLNGPLINQVFLYDVTNEQGGLLPDVSHMYSMLATVLLTESLTVLNDTRNRDAANIDDIETGLSAQENSSAPYGSTVAYRLIFPSAKIKRFAVLFGLHSLAHTIYAAPRLPGPERDKLVRERFQASGLPGLSGRLATELRLPTPEVPPPLASEEWGIAAEALLQARHDHDVRLAALEPRAVEFAQVCGDEIKRTLQQSFHELLAVPSRHTPHDVAIICDEMLAGSDKLIHQTQSELARLDLPALAEQFERSVLLLREVQTRRTWWFQRRSWCLAQFQAATNLAVYARAGHKALLLRTAAETLSQVRSLLQGLPDHARKTCQAGQAALRILEQLAREARERIGQHQIFVREAVNGAWRKPGSRNTLPARTGHTGATNCSARNCRG